MVWLVLGGLAYTAGVGFFAAKRLRFGHFVWHLFVIAGTTCHFFAVLGTRDEAALVEKPQLNLYWCWTDDHDEDWFVVARSGAGARRFHENAEGYDAGDAASMRIARVPPEFCRTGRSRWPSRRLLEACGDEIERWETPRVVTIKRRRYVEGMLDHEVLRVTDDHFEAHGRGRPNRTERARES